MERINRLYGTKFEVVMYKGGGPVAQDLGSNVLRCAYDGVGSHIQRHNADMLKILATADTTVVRAPLIRSQLPGYTFTNWYGFAIPNKSNLIDNKKVVNIIKEFGTYKQINILTDSGGFIVEKPYININSYLIKETRMYQQ
jgi:tripartite-type tricarboxylate transporter receptor subunit TctC